MDDSSIENVSSEPVNGSRAECFIVRVDVSGAIRVTMRGQDVVKAGVRLITIAETRGQ
jgi:hypothetical protein